jgi:hypothetical protein
MRHPIFLILSFLLAGCAATSQAIPKDLPTSTPAATRTPLPSSTITTTPTVSSVSSIILVFTQSGGIAGRTKTWTLYSDGRLTDGKTDIRVSSQSTQELVTALTKANMRELSRSTPRAMTCMDCTQEKLTLKDGEKEYVVIATMEDQNTPKDIQAVFQTVEQFIKKATQP